MTAPMSLCGPVMKECRRGQDVSVDGAFAVALADLGGQGGGVVAALIEPLMQVRLEVVRLRRAGLVKDIVGRASGSALQADQAAEVVGGRPTNAPSLMSRTRWPTRRRPAAASAVLTL